MITQTRNVACTATATARACRQAASSPTGALAAAASAARSAADWARCRATMTDPTAIPPTLTVSNAETRIAASTVADPRSSLTRFAGRDGPSDDDHSRQNRRPATDTRDDVAAVLAHFDCGSRGCQAARRDGPGLVTAGGQSCSLSRCVDAAGLQGDGSDAGQAEDQHCNDARDGEGGLDGGESLIG